MAGQFCQFRAHYLGGYQNPPRYLNSFENGHNTFSNDFLDFDHFCDLSIVAQYQIYAKHNGFAKLADNEKYWYANTCDRKLVSWHFLRCSKVLVHVLHMSRARNLCRHQMHI